MPISGLDELGRNPRSIFASVVRSDPRSPRNDASVFEMVVSRILYSLRGGVLGRRIHIAAGNRVH
jgi:hypothetical protein